MPATYENIATTTASGSTNSVTFSSISGSFTDLVLVINGATITSSNNVAIQFNGDTTTNYSYTVLRGNGTTATSDRGTSVAQIRLDSQAFADTVQNAYTTIIHVMNYANATTNKTVLIRANNAGQGTSATVGLWRKTPEAINSIKVFVEGGTINFASTSTFTLYGIKAA